MGTTNLDSLIRKRSSSFLGFGVWLLALSWLVMVLSCAINEVHKPQPIAAESPVQHLAAEPVGQSFPEFPIEVGRVIPGTDGTQPQRSQWKTVGEWAVIHGKDGDLYVSYQADEDRFYLLSLGHGDKADITGVTPAEAPPNIQAMFGGAYNIVYIQIRKP